jgi:hypothetical protein
LCTNSATKSATHRSSRCYPGGGGVLRYWSVHGEIPYTIQYRHLRSRLYQDSIGITTMASPHDTHCHMSRDCVIGLRTGPITDASWDKRSHMFGTNAFVPNMRGDVTLFQNSLRFCSRSLYPIISTKKGHEYEYKYPRSL